MRVELLHVPDCPHVANARRLLHECLAELKITALVEEHQGAYSSPTILVDGRDVMGGSMADGAACRLDQPTREAILAALGAAGGG